MNNLKEYILEKLVIDKNTYIENSFEKFLNTFDGYNLRHHIIRLAKSCINKLENGTQEKTYIVRRGKVENYAPNYKWYGNRNNLDLAIGDKTETGSTVVYVFKKGDKLPKNIE